MGIIYLMCGIPGSGKTTYILDTIQKIQEQNTKKVTVAHVSRDVIRFNIINSLYGENYDGEQYFTNEKEVWNIYVKEIQNYINRNYDFIFVDATHLNERSRNKILDCLDLKTYNIIPISFENMLQTCLLRNEFRKNNKLAYVPPSVIKNMSESYKIPTFDEKYKYLEIIHINEAGAHYDFIYD